MADAIPQGKKLAMGQKVNTGAAGDRGPVQKYARGGRVTASKRSSGMPSKGKSRC